MSFILSLLGLVTRVWDFLHDRGQQQIGASKQVIADDAKTIEVQQRELQAEANRPNDAQLHDDLLHGKF